MGSPPSHRARLAAALLLALGATAVSLVLPHPASAASGIRYGLHDDAWLTDGPGSLDDRLDKLDALGVQIVRFTLRWDQISRRRPVQASDPADAAYDWRESDEILDGLRSRGIGVVVGLVGTPRWANGGRASNYAPTSAATFGSFATAAARHYSWVRRWLVWNEPNQARWLRPTQPGIYVARLLNPAYAAIHRAIPGAKIGGGVTAPRGSAGGVSPVDWIRGMHAAHARLDAYAHNPYPLNPRVESPTTGGCSHCRTISMATIGKLVAEVSRNFPAARIWLTEYGYQTNPPDRVLGISSALQARYVGEAALRAYRTPRVDMLIQFLYRDEPNVARFQSGLVRLNGAPKPALAAFQLPLAQVSRRGARTTLWGQVRAPEAGGRYRVQKLVGQRWTDVTATLRAHAGGFFGYTGTLPRGTRVRVVGGDLASPALVVT